MAEDQGRRTGPAPSRAAAPSDPGMNTLVSRARGDRRGSVRVAARHGVVAPVMTILYSVSTWDRPNRPAMLVVSAALLAVALLISAAAPLLARGQRFAPATLVGVFLHIGGYAWLGFLDGGVGGPLGGLVLLAMAFIAITVPFRPFVPVAVASMIAYTSVALLGPPAARGYAVISAVSFLAASLVLARHATALASLRRRLTDLTRMDPLTGCLNRRGFDDRLTEEESRADRTDRPFSLVTVDLDAFKAVNDTFGHQAGDDLLAWTGRTLRDALPAPHAVARLGGDEFAVLLPDVDATDLPPLIDRCREALGDVSPASLGHGSYPDEADDLHQLQVLADHRMYEDKRARAGSGPVGRRDVAERPPRTEPAPVQVSTVERRQRSISDLGWISGIDFPMGVAYALTAPEIDGRLVAVLVAGSIIALGILGGSGWLARHRAGILLWNVFGPSLFVLAHVASVLDGGASSAVALGSLAPLMVVALTVPLRVVVPMAAIVTASYLAMGVFVGDTSAWYLAFHLVGGLVVAATCAHQGRVAALRRRLLVELSRVDSLTACLNRRGFEERFQEELTRARQEGIDLSIAIVDLDGFKEVNDSHGHAAGDELLTWVAETLRSTVRAHDVVGRLGGDEFIALLPGCPAGEAAALVDRVVAALAERTGVSVGTASLDRDDDALPALYRRADAALYQRKARKRAEQALREGAATKPARSAVSPVPVRPRRLRLL